MAVLARELPPYEYLHEHLTYDADTGQFWWRIARRGRRMNNEVGSINKASGYRIIRLTDYDAATGYYAHRVAWKMYHGDIDTHMTVDHINRQRDDNRIDNLRLMLLQDQAGNRDDPVWEGREGMPRCVHVTTNIDRPYRVMLSVNGKQKHIGMYASVEDAVLARDAALKAI